MAQKAQDAFRTISEVADWLDIPAHVLRFWESKFSQIKPVKRAGGRRYYRPEDMLLIGGIKKLLHVDGLTIRGVQKILNEEGVKHVASLSPELSLPTDDQADARRKARHEKRAARRKAAEADDAIAAVPPTTEPNVSVAPEAAENTVISMPGAVNQYDVSDTVSAPLEPVIDEPDERAISISASRRASVKTTTSLRKAAVIGNVAHKDLGVLHTRLMVLRNRIAKDIDAG